MELSIWTASHDGYIGEPNDFQANSGQATSIVQMIPRTSQTVVFETLTARNS
jgi:hypothetical protein